MPRAHSLHVPAPVRRARTGALPPTSRTGIPRVEQARSRRGPASAGGGGPGLGGWGRAGPSGRSGGGGAATGGGAAPGGGILGGGALPASPFSTAWLGRPASAESISTFSGASFTTSKARPSTQLSHAL